MIVDLTLEQTEGNPSHPAHGRSPIYLPGTATHGLTRRWGLVNPYDQSPVSVANEYIVMTGHTGTHLDAPFHVNRASALTVERIPLERTMGAAIWLDLREFSQEGSIISAEDLANAEEQHDERIRPGDIVLIHTGWLSQWTTRDALTNVSAAPSLSREAGEWLRFRGIKALGVDFASPDGHMSRDLPIHLNFLNPRSIGRDEEAYILIYENLMNISSIPARRFDFYGVPLPFTGATGSPVRAFAVA